MAHGGDWARQMTIYCDHWTFFCCRPPRTVAAVSELHEAIRESFSFSHRLAGRALSPNLSILASPEFTHAQMNMQQMGDVVSRILETQRT